MHLSIFELITSLQYAGIFLLSTVCAPELIMPIVGYLAWTGAISAVGGLVAGVIGATLGAVVIYGFARTFKGEALNKLVARYGSRLPDVSHPDSGNKLKYAVLLSRFIPGVRSAMSIPAGLRKMPVVAFVALAALGNIIWLTLLTVLGYLANTGYQSVQSSASHAAITSGVVLVVIIAAKLMHDHVRSAARKHTPLAH